MTKLSVAGQDAGARHTPGPWRVVGRDPTPESRRFGYWDVEGKSNVANDLTYDDACLIAAAPELYEALKLVVQRCGPNSTDGAIARAALAKARGEHPQSTREGVDRG